MFVKQLSIFVENKSGRLADIIDAIAAAGIDIRAVSIADTTDFGILRLLSLINISEPTRPELISYAVFCLILWQRWLNYTTLTLKINQLIQRRFNFTKFQTRFVAFSLSLIHI